MISQLQSAGDKITVIFIWLAELGTVPKISILVHTDLGDLVYVTNPLANYESPKLIAVWGTTLLLLLLLLPLLLLLLLLD